VRGKRKKVNSTGGGGNKRQKKKFLSELNGGEGTVKGRREDRFEPKERKLK